MLEVPVVVFEHTVLERRELVHDDTDTFVFVATTASGILLYKAKETIAATESWGMPESLIFRAEAGIMRLVMAMKQKEVVNHFGNKRVAWSGEDAHRL